MHRVSTIVRVLWRRARWVAGGVGMAALWACNSHTLVAPIGAPKQVVTHKFQQTVNHDLDILFMVDNSLSMTQLQQKMAAQLPTFMNQLTPLKPNLHVAVVSSSLGAGIFSDVPSCMPGTVGNQGGAFQHDVARCAAKGWHAGEKFLISTNDATAPGGVRNNFDGDIATVFSCIALLGDQGCGFEHQFASTMAALQKASDPNDADNGGFLRPDAFLAIVMLTNEDDCSAPWDSTLFDPSVFTLADPSGLGGLSSGYRCNEFGHLCDGVPPPHSVATPVTLTGCTSSEGMSPPLDPHHQLIRVADFVSFLNGLKPDEPDKILVAALAGPPTPYVVGTQTYTLRNAGTESQPTIQHSCTSGATGTAFADPGVRIKNWLDAFGGHGVLESICDDDFSTSMQAIARAIGKQLVDQCVQGRIASRSDAAGTPNCDVAIATVDPSTNATAKSDLPFCDGRGDFPCWHLVADDPNCLAVGDVPNQRLEICYDAACSPALQPMTESNVEIACALDP